MDGFVYKDTPPGMAGSTTGTLPQCNYAWSVAYPGVPLLGHWWVLNIPLNVWDDPLKNVQMSISNANEN